MRIDNWDIPGIPGYDLDATGASRPWFWYGNVAIAASAPWNDAPIGSLYLRIYAGSVSVWAKTVDNNATADWQELMRAGGSHTGSLTVTGDVNVTGNVTASDTITAGDFIATNEAAAPEAPAPKGRKK